MARRGRKRRRQGGLGAVVGVAVLLVLAGAALLGAWAFVWPKGPGGERFVVIRAGEGSRGIASELERAGVIRTRWAFEAERVVRGGVLKAGTYRFAEPRTVGSVYQQIARGEVYTVTITVPEGANLFDIAERVAALKLGTYDGFLAGAKRNVGLVKRFDPGAKTLEGYLFPDTYRFAPGLEVDGIQAAMVRRFEVEAAALGLAGGDVKRVVTLASLVERETPKDSERPLVASVFANRLARGMPLETDPTVIYASLLAGHYRGAIYRSDLAQDSDYNTYKHVGLPPGPICNPGAVSLRAAMAPPKTDYLYFVAAGADPQGRSRFAATLAEHERNVAEYRAAVRGR